MMRMMVMMRRGRVVMRVLVLRLQAFLLLPRFALLLERDGVDAMMLIIEMVVMMMMQVIIVRKRLQQIDFVRVWEMMMERVAMQHGGQRRGQLQLQLCAQCAQ